MLPDPYYSICCTLAVFFLWSGWLCLFGPAFIAAEFRKWNYPDWLRVAVGIAEWSIAAMLVAQFAPRIAIALAVAIVLAVILTFIRDRQFMRLEVPLLLLALLAIAYPLSPTIGVN